MSQNQPKKTTMSDLEPLLKAAWMDQLNDQLKFQSRVIGDFKGFTPYKPTFKEKWKVFWNHIPDFIDYIKEYKYIDWRYWDKDGY